MANAGGLLVLVLALLVAGDEGAGQRAAWPLHRYRLLVTLVLMSTPVGLPLASVRLR